MTATDFPVTTLLTLDPISVSRLAEEVASHSSGAILTFSGNVRDHDHGKSVESLRYEIHPTSSQILSETVGEIASRHNLTGIAVAHRYGEIPIGETAFAVAVAAAHRGEAFVACTELVDEIKSKMPIWKHQVFTDGTDEWVNCA
ncbi:MAG: molybdenum cofactor biosynthesis protein MoaE [Candidatus Nanopelagicaceae bacterium]|nr:molybdenum cofactor biosynthesis protein MoaE [Candidatus Nanopelagicaceae bacterium]